MTSPFDAMASLRYTPLLTEKRMEAMLSTVKERSNALCLLLLCGEKRTGGRITNCSSWSGQQWTLACGVDGKPKDCHLYHWEGDDLIVDIYDTEAETSASAKSESCRASAKARWNKNNANAMQTQCERNANADANADANAMQTHMQAACKSNASTDANASDSHMQGKDKISNINKTCSGNTPLNSVRELSPAQAQQFREWMSAIAPCHPATALRSESSYLPAEIESAAVTAFLSLPNAPQYAEMLAAYMRSKQETDVHRNPYFRPNKEALFFSALGDWIGHAQRWAKETKWRPRPTNTTPPHPQPQQTEQPNATEQEQDEMLAWLANNKTTTHTTNQQ